MNENITISYEEYKKLILAEMHLAFLLELAARAKYSHEVDEAVRFIRSIRDPGFEVNSDAE